MESSPIQGNGEECSGNSGSESGWTSYIVSSIKETNHHHDDDADDYRINIHGDYRKDNYGIEDGGAESDDSMASDASSGPSHFELPSRNTVGNPVMGPSRHARSKYSSEEKLMNKGKKNVVICKPA